MSAAFTAAEIARAIHAQLPCAAELVFPAVSTDTRSLLQGALFVALKGERYDAHDHLAKARDAGAAAAVVRRGTAPIEGLPLFEVENTLVALGDLAAAHRRKFNGPVIAITGQNGKTSTKEMVAAVLATKWKTHKTEGNHNNLVGVPLTVLDAPEDAEAWVVEAGANMPGEIARFREILKPDIAVITSVGSGHLEGFGSVEGVLREKLSLTLGVPLAIVHGTPPELPEGARARAQRVILTGLGPGDVYPTGMMFGPEGRHLVMVDGYKFTLAARGLHQVANAMIAWAVAREYNLNLEKCARALETFTLPGGRGELSKHGDLLILNDSYNANPESFTEAIQLARGFRIERKLVFVAGSMRELGDHSVSLHARVAKELAELQPELLALVGDFIPAFAPLKATYTGRIIEAPDAETMGQLLAKEITGKELLVLKGSRGVALERIIPHLLTRATA